MQQAQRLRPNSSRCQNNETFASRRPAVSYSVCLDDSSRCGGIPNGCSRGPNLVGVINCTVITLHCNRMRKSIRPSTHGQKFFGTSPYNYRRNSKEAAEVRRGECFSALDCRIRGRQRTNDDGAKNRCASGGATVHELRQGLRAEQALRSQPEVLLVQV
jgi:hypothetical protein